ncbi:MAG: ABC transporter permease [Spirochaetia bacterium]
MKYANIAFRNLNRQKKRTFLLGGAIAFGIMVVTMINGCTGGFITNIEENFSHFMAGHIFLQGYEKTERGNNISIIRDDEVLLEAIEEADIPVDQIIRRSTFQGNLIFEGESAFQKIDGIHTEQETSLRERLDLIEGEFDFQEHPDGILISQEIAESLMVTVGDRMLVRMETVTGQQNTGDFYVSGIFNDPGFLGSISAYADIDYVNQLLNIAQDEFITLGIFLENINAIDSSASALYQVLQEREVRTFSRMDTQNQMGMQRTLQEEMDESWEGTRYRLYTLTDMLTSVQQLVSTLNTAAFVILIILFIIIMVGITNTFRMIVYERTKEIGTMRALGMQRGAVRRIFIYEAMFLAIAGAFIGVALAGVFSFAAGIPAFSESSPIYMLTKNGHLFFRAPISQIIGNIAFVAVFSFFSVLLPAMKAAKLEPANALRKAY